MFVCHCEFHWCALVMSRPSGGVKGEGQLAGVISGPIFPWDMGGDREHRDVWQCCSDTTSPGSLSSLKHVVTLVRLQT